jgi:hypothetical protein
MAQSIGRKRKTDEHNAARKGKVGSASARNSAMPDCKVGSMSHLNELVEAAWIARTSGGASRSAMQPDPSFLHEYAWEQWLWHENPAEESHIDLLMNHMHLLGLLIARSVHG